MIFSNPRLYAEFTDWPLGHGKRGQCVFQILQDPTRGCRFSRTTFGKPKVSTFGGPAAIVDGADGRTYVIQADRGGYECITVWRSDFKHEQVVFKRNEPYRYEELLALIMVGIAAPPAEGSPDVIAEQQES